MRHTAAVLWSVPTLAQLDRAHTRQWIYTTIRVLPHGKSNSSAVCVLCHIAAQACPAASPVHGNAAVEVDLVPVDSMREPLQVPVLRVVPVVGVPPLQ